MKSIIKRKRAKPDPRVWKSKHGKIPIMDMNDSHLKNAYLFAQKRQLFFHNRSNSFKRLVHQLREEAEKRGLKLKQYHEVKKGTLGYFTENS